MENKLQITFCTYFKSITEFKYICETYDTYTAFCLKSGSFSYKIDIENILSAGEMIICPPGIPFFRKIINTSELLMIKFKTSENLSCLSKNIIFSDLIRLNYNLSKLENCIFFQFTESNPIYAHYCRDILYMAFDDYSSNNFFSDIKNYMDNNFCKNINIKSLSEKVGYSQTQFINLFKKNYKLTPKQYILQLRLNKAKQLLATSEKSTKEIAYMCGFDDELYFIKFFKKNMGMTSKTFRNRIKQITP